MGYSVDGPGVESGPQKLKVSRFFTQYGKHPFNSVTWGNRDARLTDAKGEITFEQKGVEAPTSWSDRAVNIVAEKYFRVIDGVKETSVKQMVYRVAHTITEAGIEAEMFATGQDAVIFEEELIFILLNQMVAFNSPVWFNIGVPGVKQQASACFIQSREDTMESIVQGLGDEMQLFRGGSGTGANLSKLRSSYELLSNGGRSSGPVSFMEVYDRGAGVTKSGGGTRRAAKMVVLNIDHPDILVQHNGRPGFITCKQEAEKVAHALIDSGLYSGEFNVPGNAYELVGFQNANNSVRVMDDFMEAVEQDGLVQTKEIKTGKVVHTYKARELWEKIAYAAWFCGDPGIQFDTTTNYWHTCPESGRINASNPCSEYLFLDDTACNLASLNLKQFYTGKAFLVEAFEAACRITITAMEILVGYSSYPNEQITKNSYDFRPLGLGFANLGALLMDMGLAYDSAEGREFAAAVTSLMSAAAYHQSTLMAQAVGPFARFAENRASFIDVLGKHTAAADRLSLGYTGPESAQNLLNRGLGLWYSTVENARKSGVRNSQISVIAPTGTISFLMDCDTTGVEPAISLVSFKKLVGGGYLKMPYKGVGRALSALGYSPGHQEQILQLLEKTGDLPKDQLKPEHVKVFQTAIGSDPVSTDGHLLMMSAIQPFLSGGISKTVNMPSTSTVHDVADAYMKAWKLGLKCVAIYRDGCKRSQPVSAKEEKKEVSGKATEPLAAEGPIFGERKRLPDDRKSLTHKFSIGGQEGYIHTGLYEDGRPGEVFVNVSKAGSTLHGFADMWATAVSIGLQYGVPLEVFVSKFKGTKFEPAGFTRAKFARMTTSFGDYMAKYLEHSFLTPPEEPEPVAVSKKPTDPVVTHTSTRAGSAAVVMAAAPVSTGDPCTACGNMTQWAGSCKVCTSCGQTTGCG